jgi:hypothetical protein
VSSNRSGIQLGAWRNAALHFGSHSENRVVFRVAQGRQNTGDLPVPVWCRSTPIVAVGFELMIPCSDDPRGSRIHEIDGLLTILTIIRVFGFCRFQRIVRTGG